MEFSKVKLFALTSVMVFSVTPAKALIEEVKPISGDGYKVKVTASDQNLLSCSFYWGDGQVESFVRAISGSCSATHYYAQSDRYLVQVKHNTTNYVYWDTKEVTIPIANPVVEPGSNVTSRPTTSNFAVWANTSGAVKLTGDFNGDGLQDIALTGPRNWRSMPVAFSNGDGTFSVTNR